MTALSISERADALEHQKMRELDVIIVKSRLFTLGDSSAPVPNGAQLMAQNPGKHMLMGDDPRLPKMPEKPTLVDFFRYRFASGAAPAAERAPARKTGYDEKMVLACLLHDIAVVGFIRSDHGYWGAQLIEPYVDEEVSWAIRSHQALRFFADESVGYEYPDMYVPLVRRRLQARRLHPGRLQARPRSTSGT